MGVSPMARKRAATPQLEKLGVRFKAPRDDDGEWCLSVEGAPSDMSWPLNVVGLGYIYGAVNDQKPTELRNFADVLERLADAAREAADGFN